MFAQVITTFAAAIAAQNTANGEVLIGTKVHPATDGSETFSAIDVARLLPDGTLAPLGTISSFGEDFSTHEAMTPRAPFLVEVTGGSDDMSAATAISDRQDLHWIAHELRMNTRDVPGFRGEQI